MSWFNVWDGLKTKTCRYLLQRYLGKFFQNKINLEQLKVDLYNGKAVVQNVSVNVEAINALFESQGWSLEVVNGHIGGMTVVVPWNALLINDSSVEVSNLFLSLRPVKREPTGASMLESMWSSVSSSIQMAEECMNQSDDDSPFEIHNNSIAGLEKFAETIDNVLNRIHAKFSNTVIEIQSISPKSGKKISVFIKINNIEYQNETGREKFNNETTNVNSKNYKMDTESKTSVNIMPSIAKHNILLLGVTVYSSENNTSFNKPDIAKINSQNFAKTFEHVTMLPILKFKGCQCINIKTKQTESIDGPKVCLDVEIGSVFTFLTPRQVHLLIQLAKSFYDENQDDSKLEESPKNKVKKYFQQNQPEVTMMGGIVRNNMNWCADTEDCMSSYRYEENRKHDIMDRSLKSSSMTYTNSTSCKYKNKNESMESSGEILTFNIQIATITTVLLHKDILNNKSIENEADLLNLKLLANKYFKYAFDGKYDREIDILNEICDGDCLFLKVAALFIKGNQQRNQDKLFTISDIVIAKFDFYEILEKKLRQLIYFDRNENGLNGFHTRPDISICIKSSFACSRNISECNSIAVTLEKCTIDMDISIYDRLSFLFGTSPFLQTYNNVRNTENGQGKSAMEISFMSPSIQINLKFPIVDARPHGDPDRFPWWKPNIRDDFLVLNFVNIVCTWDLSKILIISNEIHAYYCDGNKNNLTKILATKILETSSKIIYPRITIELKSENLPISTPRNNYSRPIYLSPFSPKQVRRHSDATLNISKTEPEDYFLPGETEEMNSFCDYAMKSSQIQVSVRLPFAEITFESKQLYEIIFNRLNSDLFMWEPSSPYLQNNKKDNHPCNECDKFAESDILPQKLMLDSFFQQNETNCSYSEKDKPTDESVYFSTNNKMSQLKNVSEILHACGVEINIDEMMLVLFVPVRDVERNVLPGQSGKFNLKTKNLKIVSITGSTCSNINYVCLQLSEIEVYHCGLLPSFNDMFTNKKINIIEDYMELTLENIKRHDKKKILLGKRKEVISLAIEIKKELQPRIKRLKISTGVSKAVLRHNPSAAVNTWLNQLIDFLDISDFPIEGYTPFGFVTEIQIHFWDSIVDYRPKNFPYRAQINISHLTTSSNIVSSISGCNLRFIAEECGLSIAPFRYSTENDPDCRTPLEDECNLVKILHFGLFDVSLWFNEEDLQKCPKIDLRCSIQDVHIRTCCDSAKAFAQLLGHIANDKKEVFCNETVNSEISQDDNIRTIPRREVSNLSLKKQQQVNMMVAEAMKDEFDTEMKPTESIEETPTSEIQLFYFPDEGISKPMSSSLSNNLEQTEDDIADNIDPSLLWTSHCLQSNCEKATPQVQNDLGKVLYKIDNTLEEREFCIIPDDNTTYKFSSEFHDITVCEDPLRIVDNHFCLPQAKPDYLRPPENFPNAENRYTLCEMTITWHLYGGYDFPISNSDAKGKRIESKRNTTGMSEAYKDGVSQQKGNLPHSSKANSFVSSRSGRNLDKLVEIQFNKISFSHEIYPENTTHASRQVLLIADIEIRDRLKSSEINKLLYHPKVKILSNKSFEHMVVVKALHIRPDLLQSSVQECSLKISILPIKLNIDQETLLFLEEYFGNLSNNTGHDEHESSNSKITIQSNPPVLTVDDLPEALKDLQTQQEVEKNLDLLMNDEKICGTEIETITTSANQSIYFREVIFSPALPICLDYHGRRIELSRGPVAGLLMGLAQLQGSGICLRELVNRRGVLGWNKLLLYLCKEWLNDIKRNQLPKILSGIGPTNAVLQLFQGIYDLFRLPIEQYQKDGRIIRGFQLGAQSFSARTAIAALEITSRIIHLLQFTAETTFDMLSSGPSVKKLKKFKKSKKRHNRPKDFREGVTNAYLIVKEGINNSANNLIETAVIEHDQKGYTGAVGAVMRQIPQLVVCPAVLATQATTNILGGAVCSLVSDAKIEARDKWKDESN